MNNTDIFTIFETFLSGLLSLWFPILFFGGFLEVMFLIRYEGKIKRGFKVWSKPLSEDFRKYLLSLSADIVETRNNLFVKQKAGFIRVRNGEILIRYRRPYWGTSWPYVGYVNLSDVEPVLEFRSSVLTHLFLAPFILTIVFIPFMGGMMLFNYYMESTAVENFLKRKIAESSK